MTVFLIPVRSETFWLNVIAPLFLDDSPLLMAFILAMNVIYSGSKINILPEEAKNQPFKMNQDNKQGAMLKI